MAGGAIGARPKRRNAVMVLVLPLLFIIGGQIIGAILAAIIDPMLAMIGSLIAMVGSILLLYYMIVMLLELKKVSQDDSFMWWLIFIPCANYYLMWVLTAQQVTKAKQMAGVQAPTRGFIVYFLLYPYALAADLNDLAGPG